MKRKIWIVMMIVMVLLLTSCSGEKEDHEGEAVVTLMIDEIKDDYFLGQDPRIMPPVKYKVFANLDENYIVGDCVAVYYDEMIKTQENIYEINSTAIESSDIELEPSLVYKPKAFVSGVVKRKNS